MRQTLFLFFIFRLLLEQIPFAIQMARDYFSPHRSFYITILLLSIYTGFFSQRIKTNRNEQLIKQSQQRISRQPQTKIEINYPPTIATTTIKMNRPQLEEQKVYWQDILAQQPTHRDALINLAIIEQVLGEKESANEHFEKAKFLNPNYQVFSQ